MDVSKETAERAESVVSDVLISDSCVENIISLIDNYEITSIENKCDQTQPLPGSDPHQETSILDILISDNSVENIISCIDSYEKTSAENKLQSLPEADSHQEPLDNDQDMTQPPSEPDAQQETEPLHTDPNKAHSAANSLNLSEDETQPPSEPDTTQETEPPDMDQDKETVLPSSRCLENSLNLSQDAHQGTQPLDMAQDKEPVLPSSRCSENPLNLSQDKTQPPSEPDATQETERLDMDQDKEPGLPFSRCSENFLNLSQGSQQSTLPPPASQQRSSGFPLSFRNSTFAKYDPAYESMMKVPKRQQRSNTISEKSKMKQIKEIHKHLYQLLKNANVLAQSDRNLLANAKQMLFSIKTHHAVLCESLKSACMRKVPLHKCRESLKEKIRLLQNRQHKLLLLFQEHNVITKKIKMLDSDWRKRDEIAAKGQSLLSRLAPKNLPSFSKSKTFTKNLKPESESASTIYSFDCSQEKKRSVKKKKKERDGSVLHKSQQSMSESAMIFNNRMNQSRQKPMSESAMISGNKMNQSCQKPMSESVVISGNKMNLSHQQPMSESTMISSNKMNQSRQQPMSESSMIFNNKMNQSHQQPMSESSMIFNNKMTQFTLQPMSELAMISDNKMNDSSQQSMSESSMISDNKMNLSSEQTMSESVKMNCSKNKFPHCSKQTSSYPINTADQTPKPDSKTPTCPSWLNKDTSDDASVSLLPNMSTNCTQFTATPIGTIADFTKNIIRSQQDFGNDQLVPKPAVTSADQQPQSSVVASLRLQNVPVSSFGDDISTSTNSQTVTANGARSFETRAKTKELQQSFDEDDCGISALTHLALIEDRELVPLDSILPSCQDTDIFANINFPKFLWEGFYKWP